VHALPSTLVQLVDGQAVHLGPFAWLVGGQTQAAIRRVGTRVDSADDGRPNDRGIPETLCEDLVGGTTRVMASAVCTVFGADWSRQCALPVSADEKNGPGVGIKAGQ
jgi:hypothetical protein